MFFDKAHPGQLVNERFYNLIFPRVFVTVASTPIR